MAIVHFAADLKNEVLTPIKDAIDAGGAAGTISIYSGTMPATVETALTTQVRLGTLTFAFSCGTIAGGALTMGAITQDSAADATGTAAWARVVDSTGAAVMDLNVTVTGGGGALTMNTTSIVAGGPILITSLVISVA